MQVPDPRHLRSLQEASALLQAGQIARARGMLEALVRAAPRLIEARRLLAGALQVSGDVPAAERALREALAIDPAWAPTRLALGELLAARGEAIEAEQCLRGALADPRTRARATSSLAELLLDRGQPQAAFDLLAASGTGDAATLALRARALIALERRDEGIALYRRAAAAAPRDGRILLDLAAALSDDGDSAEAEAAARAALAAGFDTSKTHLVLAHALLGQDRFDESEAVLVATLDRWPTYQEAHRNLAELRWMRTADAAAATARIDAVLAREPGQHALRLIKARILDYAGEPESAYAGVAAALAAGADEVALHRAASESAMRFDPARALAHARRAAVLAPEDAAIGATLAQALVCAGQAAEAAALAAAHLQRHPDDQHMIAVRSAAWRLSGDPRYAEVSDYANLVHGWTIDTPPGWPDLPSYLADLATSLRRLHTLKTHPVGQSLRHGTQTARDLGRSDDPAIRAFPGAIDAPIRRHIAALGEPAGTPYRIAGMWSVQLAPDGYHANHMHPRGWLSSACYIDLPAAVTGGGREGWIKFGEPALATDPPLPPEHYVKPEPGLLVLFPSWMWHGTVPFSGSDRRLTIAFDVVRA
jgi:tetratricopeptide (TPR) repeat protein